MNWLNILILAVLVLCVFNGIQRGMIRAAFALVSVILTLILGFILNPYVTEFLKEETPVYEVIQVKCEESISQALEEQLEQKINEEQQNQFIETLSMPDNLKKMLIKNNNTEGYRHLLAESFGEYLSHSIAQLAVGAISLIITFLFISILMNITGGLLQGIFSLPILSLVNRAGGGVLGAVQGVFVVWVIFLVITLFWDAQWAQTAAEMLEENSVTAYLYDNNLLVRFLSGVL